MTLALAARRQIGYALGRAAGGLDWRYVGPTYWAAYQSSIQATNAAHSSNPDTLTTPTGVYPGSAAFIGGVLLPDGRVFCVPHNSTSARIYDGSDVQYDINVALSAYYNKL